MCPRLPNGDVPSAIIHEGSARFCARSFLVGLYFLECSDWSILFEEFSNRSTFLSSFLIGLFFEGIF